MSTFSTRINPEVQLKLMGMSLVWWFIRKNKNLMMKIQGKVIIIHPLGHMNVCTKFLGNRYSTFRYFSLDQSGGVTKVEWQTPARGTLLACLTIISCSCGKILSYCTSLGHTQNQNSASLFVSHVSVLFLTLSSYNLSVVSIGNLLFNSHPMARNICQLLQ